MHMLCKSVYYNKSSHFLCSECCSMVGKVGGRQVLTLATWQCFAFSTIVHELGHVIGFFHEVSRPDRDEYITVHTENIRPQWLHAFHKMDTKDVKDLGVPYDYHSVMHYEKYTFTKNNGPTIEVKSGFSIYNGELSPCDAKEARLLYSCPSEFGARIVIILYVHDRFICIHFTCTGDII